MWKSAGSHDPDIQSGLDRGLLYGSAGCVTLAPELLAGADCCSFFGCHSSRVLFRWIRGW